MSRMSRPSRSRERPTAFGAAVSMLSRRDLSEGEVRTRLADREYTEDEIESAVTRLHERRYLDDRGLALAVARNRAERNLHGPLQVSAHLRKRLIPAALADEAIREAFPEGAEHERAQEALERIVRTNRSRSDAARPDEKPFVRARRIRNRLLRRLLSRGYSAEAAHDAVSHHLSLVENESGADA